MNNYGQTIKKIRVGKGLSQRYVSNNICTQGNFSKFELGENKDIKHSTLSEFLVRIETSYEEFKYINNGYNMSLRDEIINNFYNQTYNNSDNLLQLQQSCISYLNECPEDKLISKINIIIKSLRILANTNDIHNAKLLAEPIWTELSRRDNLYLSDIFLLNAILYIFPVDTAVEMKNFAFRHIEKYKNFQNINRIKINFLVNLSLLYLKNNDYNMALEQLENSIELCKIEKQFINLSICYIRKGVCLNNMGTRGLYWINKGMSMLEVLDQFDLLSILKAEIKQYST
ncbi:MULTISPECIES: XRE family transcriptional regulator [Solibacillus]|uniref:XRE family transcriptional regulator n=1 Tax=Solibacillus merdavium TaxID=2762218 RepID=A0ABR8XKP2_9BACL|nr:XRE family transcriptional regulator [Solibacillus merdavium]MBD8032490.1 XRE family transcriptional regulator [Solibacillus merdavium]